MKEYKSNIDLLNYLLSKGVIVKNKKQALQYFERYTYYSIINTYKEVFKKNGNYVNNVTFEEIFALYEFDKNLKNIFLQYSLEIEIIIKSLIANIVTEKYGIKNYLKIKNFDSFANISSIIKLINNINQEIQENYGKHLAITHYQDKYGFIPPFVLVKILTFGQISRYYGLLKQVDRQKVSSYFNLSDKILKQILMNVTLVRNFSAHNNRLYTFHSKFFISFKLIDKSYNISGNSTNIYMIMKCMELLLDKNRKKQFNRQVKNEIKKLEKKLKSINIKDILNIMGFPSVY